MVGHESLTAHTRFAVPHIPNATISRHALLNRLDTATHRLTVVSAPPGSGKSALLADWANNLRSPLAWLSCDIDDADQAWFWRDVRAAIQHSWPDSALNDLDPVDQRDPRQLAIEIANALVSVRGGVIVIDDYHLAGPAPAAMIAFIDALPADLRLVLGSRRDPPFSLSRMRVQGRLLELRQDDLRFDAAETQELLAGLGVELSPAHLDRLIEVTEGWPVGVYLAGLSLRGVGTPDAVLGRLVDTDRSLVDFLMNEVIDLQSADMQEFLSVTGQLDTFDAALCNAVTGSADSASLLERVRAANLFLVGLDREGQWYRYHHLFNEFLRARMRATSPGRISTIHSTAADTFAERGDLLNAVRHYLRAGDTDAALKHFGNHMAKTTNLTDKTLAAVVARAWLDEHGSRRLESDPHTVLECVIALDGAQAHDVADRWLTQVEATRGRLDPQTEFVLDGAWSFHRLCRGDPEGAIAHGRQALTILDQHAIGNKWLPTLASMLVQAHVSLDDLDGAVAIIDFMRDSGNVNPVVDSVKMPGHASVIAVLAGDLVAAERFASQSESAADQLEVPAWAFARAEAVLASIEIAIEADQLDLAEERADRLFRILDHEYRPWMAMAAQLIQARMASTRGDDAEVAARLDKARRTMPTATTAVVAQIDRVELRHALERGAADVETLLARLPPSPATDLLVARARLASGDDDGARAVLAHVPVDTTPRWRIDHGILSALALASSDTTLAHRQLHAALTLAEAGGFQGSIVKEGPRLWTLLESLPTSGGLGDYVSRLLNLAGRIVPPPRVPSQERLVEPLSDRELTVLRYLTSRLDATEIADALYISVNTVRSHIKAIYRKLGVATRADAVRQGRLLGLI